MSANVIGVWIAGGIAMGYFVAAFFFLQFWREKKERLFLFFTAGFLILALHWTIFGLAYGHSEALTFGLRLAGFVVILIGILERRMRARGQDPGD